MAVIDIDPSLAHFKPTCIKYLISVRIKMDLKYITIL
jgi:hypothetical protein